MTQHHSDFQNLHATTDLMELITELQMQAAKIKKTNPEKFETTVKFIDRLIKIQSIYFKLSGEALFWRLEAQHQKKINTAYLLKIGDLKQRIDFLESLEKEISL